MPQLGMKRRTFNKVVQCAEASTPGAVKLLLHGLPAVVRLLIESDLESRRAAKHYDSVSRQAYFFRGQTNGLIVWSWHGLASNAEAASLFSLLDSVESPLDENIASALFNRATGRSVDEPQAFAAADRKRFV